MKNWKKGLLLGVAFVLSSNALWAQEVNYDENKIPPYTLEDPLRFVYGRKVRNAKDWELRRQEILDIFQREMYGQIPPKSEITTEVIEEGITLAGFATRQQVRMWFRSDKSGPKVDWLVIVPRFTKGPVPTVLFLNYTGNQALLTDKEILLNDGWAIAGKGVVENRATEETRGSYAGQSTDTVYPIGMLVARGYAVVTACYGDISPDPNGAAEQDRLAYTEIFDLWGPRDNSRDDNTTSLGAWGWTLMRAMDMIEQDSRLDAKRVLLTGYSRLAKAALVAGAYDDRFPVVVPVQTGGGGCPLSKRFYGENIATMTQSFTHWYCKAWKKYAGKEQTMPFDQHLFLACVAPRALLVEGFDDPWYDTKAEFLALQAASPVWKKLGKPGLPKVDWPDDFDTKAIGPTIGYVRRSQKHGISAHDWLWMLNFAEGVWEK